MRAMLCLLLCISTIGFCFSQENLDTTSSNQTKKYAITVAPTLFPIDNVALSSGIQIRISKKISWITEVSIPLTNNATGFVTDVNFFRVSTEVKRYLNNADEGKFLGLQVGYSSRNFFDADSGRYMKHFFGDTVYTYSSTKIKSPFGFVLLKWGKEIVQWKTFYLDYFVGLGLKFISTDYQGENISSRPIHVTVKDPKIFKDWPSWEFERNYCRINGTLGVRIGMRF